METVQVKEKESEQQNEPLKTQQTEEEEEGEDRISSLPDCLLHEILSRLRLTKYAIRTGILSKRWQHLWPSVPCLSFDYYRDFNRHSCFYYKPSPDLYLAVDKTLNQCQSKNIIKFKVSAIYGLGFESHVENWIHFATSHNVQQFHLCLERVNLRPFVLKDDSFLVNSRFTHLELQGCLFSPMKPISWNNLTHLTISHMEVYQDSIAKILSGSPLLDTLVLKYCDGYSCLDITSKSVKSLEISGYEALEKHFVVEINAPYISSLKITEGLWLWKILLRDVSSLVKADLDFTMSSFRGNPALKKDEDEMLKSLILNLCQVKELKTGSFCYEVLARLEVKGFIFPSNLKGVDVTSDLYSSAYSRALVDCRNSYSSDSSSSESNASYSDAYNRDAYNFSDAYDSDYISSGDSEEPVLEEVLARLEVKGFIFPSNLKGVNVTSRSYSSAYSGALVDCRNSYSSDSSSSESDVSDSDAYNTDAYDLNAYDSDYISSGDS